MNVNTNSWHYKLVYEATYSNPPNNLCPYVRKLVSSILFRAVIGLILIIIVAALSTWFVGNITMVCALFGVGGNDFATWLEHGLYAGPAVVGNLTTVILLLWWGGQAAMEQTRSALDSRASSPKREPNIFMAWLKAKHDKVCPQLTFTDGTDSS